MCLSSWTQLLGKKDHSVSISIVWAQATKQYKVGINIRDFEVTQTQV